MSQTVANRSSASEAMLTAGAAGRALMGGTRAMRAAGQLFLPRFPSESDEAYRARRDASFLFNGYRRTVRQMTGRVFDKPVEVSETPARITQWAQNVDMQGNDLSVFARDVFECALAGPGLSFVMADAPARQGAVTQAQAQAAGLRPYLVHIKAEDVLGWKVATINNAPAVTQLRIIEKVSEDTDDEFEQMEVEQVRVLDLTDAGVVTRLFRRGRSEAWALYGDPVLSPLRRITVRPFYATRTGFWQAEPPLEDLADLNVAHWQSSSDQRNILHFARVPLLHATGRDEDEGPLVASAGTATTSRDPAARLEWVEHSGAAIGAGREDLKDLEFQMQVQGLQLLVARQETATGAALDAAKETSALAMMADALQDCLEGALQDMAEYAGEPGADVSVAVNKDFGVMPMGAQEMQAMLMAVNTGNMSRETFLREMTRRGMLRADLDPLDEAERIEAEGGGLSDGGE